MSKHQITIIGEHAMDANMDFICDFIPDWDENIPEDLVFEFDAMANEIQLNNITEDVFRKYINYVDKHSKPYMVNVPVIYDISMYEHDVFRIPISNFFRLNGFEEYEQAWSNRFVFNFPKLFDILVCRRLLKNPLIAFKCPYTGYMVSDLKRRTRWAVNLQKIYIKHLKDNKLPCKPIKEDRWGRELINQVQRRNLALRRKKNG